MDTPESLPPESTPSEPASLQEPASQFDRLSLSSNAPPVAPSRDHARLFVGIGVALIVIALIALGVLIVPRLINPASAPKPTAAAAMPINTQVLLSINPHFDQLPNGEVVKKAWGDSTFESDLRATLHQLGIDWDKDVGPWLGDEIAFGMTDLKVAQSEAETTPPVLMIVAASDTSGLNALLARARTGAESQGYKVREENYRGVSIVELIGWLPNMHDVYAVADNFLIFSNRVDEVHASIDAITDKKGLDQSRSYQATLAELRGDRAATMYLDLTPFKTAIGQTPSVSALGEAGQTAVDAVQGFGLGLTFEPNGLRLEMVVASDADKLPLDQPSALRVKSNPNELLRAVPDTAILYASGYNLAGTIGPFLDGLAASNPEVGVALRNFQQTAGLDLQRDLFGWVTGEYALVVLPGALSGATQLPMDFAFVAEEPQRRQAMPVVHKLIQALAAESNAKIDDISMPYVTLKGVLDSNGNPIVMYGPFGDSKFMLTTSRPAAQKILDATARPLAEGELFRAATAPLPVSNSGYLYLKPKPIIDLLSLGLTMSGQDCGLCSWFDPVKAIASTSDQPSRRANIVRAEMFVLLDVK